MTVIYIRHGDDGEPNRSYPNDPSLVKDSYPSIRRLARRLLKKFGRPDAIYVSPMRRAWETALIMEETFERKVPLILDPHLSRYFTRQEKDPETVRPDTLERKAPIFESKQQFRDRVHRHMKHLSPCYYQRRPLIWCVTHALVLKRIGRTFDLDLKPRFDFLETLVIDPSRLD